jgi:hypothetical protein
MVPSVDSHSQHGQPCLLHSSALPRRGVLTALIFICSAVIALDLADRTRKDASAVIRIPAECGNPATCFMHAQKYLAGTSLGRELRANERVKISCMQRATIAEAP